MKHLLIVVIALLAGCAAPPREDPSANYSTPALKAAALKCDYEATMGTQTTNPAMRSMFGQELDRAIRKRELFSLCMRANGG